MDFVPNHIYFFVQVNHLGMTEVLLKIIMFGEGHTSFYFFKCHVIFPFPIPTVTQFLRDKSAIKGTLLGLRHFFAVECPLNLINDAIYFTLKVLFALKMFKYLSCFFGHLKKRLN